MKRLLLLPFFFSLPVLGAESFMKKAEDFKSEIIEVPNDNLTTRNMRGPLKVFHDNNGFVVAHNSIITRVKSYDVDKDLRKMDVERAAKILAATQLRVVRLNNGSYTVVRHGELKGGGVLGGKIAFWVGVGSVYALQQVAAVSGAAAASVVGGPHVGGATYAAIIAKTTPITIVTAKTVGLLGAITFGVATGPV